MLSTFTTEHGALIVRTQDIRRIEDLSSGGTLLAWVEVERADMPRTMVITGTARENLERLQREELEAIEKFKRAEQRQSQGLPTLPVVRGGKAAPHG